MAAHKLLIVDDSLMLLRFAANVLSQNFPDMEIITAKRGAEGIARAQSAVPDLILLDFVLPDLLGDEVCLRIHQNRETTQTPIVVMSSGTGETKDIEKRHPNVVKTINKPFTPELLVATIKGLFEDQAAMHVTPLVRIRERFQLPEVVLADNGKKGLAPRHVVLRGDTGAFSLRSVLHAIRDQKLSGCLRITPAKGQPTNTFAKDGMIILTASRDSMQHRERAGDLLRSLPPVVVETVLQGQTDSGCPFPLLLALRDAIPQADAIAWTDRLGMEIFAQHWLGEKLTFEFEKLPVFPDWLVRYDAEPFEVAEWISGTLRCLGPTNVTVPADEKFDGYPAYTRGGYELVQHLNLTDLESAFAACVNGTLTLREIGERLNLPDRTVYVLLFRFRALEAMEYWPASVLAAGPRVAAPTLGRAMDEEFLVEADPEPAEVHPVNDAHTEEEPQAALAQAAEALNAALSAPPAPEAEPEPVLVPEAVAPAVETAPAQAELPMETLAIESAPTNDHPQVEAALVQPVIEHPHSVAAEEPPSPKADFVPIAGTNPRPMVTEVEKHPYRREMFPEMSPSEAGAAQRRSTPRIAQILVANSSASEPAAVAGQPKRFTVRIS